MKAQNFTMRMQKLAFLLGSGLFALNTYAYKYVGPEVRGTEGQKPNAVSEEKAAGCAPAAELTTLEFNNVRALIETGGSMWQNRATSRASYIVPADGDVSVLYAGALWMGGISPDQQLKLAAVRFRTEGNDYWAGPLTPGSAEIDAATCSEYDKFYPVSKADVEQHRRYFDCQNDPLCDLEEEFADNPYVIPQYFYDWPATYQGNTLAPWYDADGDGDYNAAEGDYPWYDLFQEISCFGRLRTDPIPLFGDYTIWWVFNDKGNVHTESKGQPIGMEIRAQAFAFSGNDEINNMTFYNYTLINQGTQILQNTYFGQWVDPDLGTSTDDYVGCDVQRGLGYCYNGDAVDESSSSSPGYGENPPAVGIDFFQGPFQDADGLDNPLTSNFSDAIDSLGIPYGGIGIGYGDDKVDNERYGMRKFLYYNNSSGNNGEPSTALDYYRYMQGFWRNGQRMSFGGDGFTTASGTDLSQPTDYMFPGDTDPFHWGTVGNITSNDWTEAAEGNPAGDRRFIQSAGPFTLEPGAYNNVTVGVVYARAASGDPFASVELVRLADDKAQALFDNCFQIVSGPDAPDVTIRELDRELVLYLTNDNPISNNYKEEYTQFDPGIPPVLVDGTELDTAQRSYNFQGYMIYQLANNEVSVADLNDVNLARLIAQCDVRDSVDVIINYTKDEVMGVPVPELMVDGENDGIRHSFRVTSDAFALGDNSLINFKTYYFLVLAYGYNNFEDYNPNLFSGQDEQFKASRKAAVGSIKVYSGIPHKNNPENGGTILQANYGDGIILTKHEGRGVGFNNVEISAESEADILENVIAEQVVYKRGAGPVDIKVVDPLRLPMADFELRLAPDDANLESDSAFWELENLTTGEVFTSTKPITVRNEELILDWGLSLTWEQVDYDGAFTEPLTSTISFKNSARPWLLGIPDQEGFTELNWIRAGTQEAGDDGTPEEVIYNDFKPGNPLDETEAYEGILGATWAPYALCAFAASDEETVVVNVAPTVQGLDGDLSPFSGISGLNNVDVVITSDKSKWTRCGVIEAQYVAELAQDADGTSTDPEKMRLRRHPSVDKNGRKPGDAGYDDAEGSLNGAQPIGMGWFPGYAIDVESGERLNMAFAEDSWLGSQNGRDMIWNPSSNIASNIGGQIYAGGQHWIYVFKNSKYEENNENRMPAYDMGAFLYQNLEADFSTSNQRRVYRSATWVGSSLLNPDYELLPIEQGLIPNDVRISLRVAKAYSKFSPLSLNYEDYSQAENNWNPLYTFTTRDVAATTNSNEELTSFLDNINVVPNPYYAYSNYEANKVDNRIKIINLPEECTISIYSINGVLIRQFQKADPLTYLDWDLKNYINIPISSGVYIIHVDVPGAGEKILKWFGVMRPVDLDNF